MRLTRQQLRKIIREVLRVSHGSEHSRLLAEELTRTDKRDIERIARKQARKEIIKVVGNDLARTIKEEVKKALKDRATKDEMADITKSVVKKMYRQLSTNYSRIIDGIKV